MRDTGFQPPAALKNRIAPADIERGRAALGRGPGPDRLSHGRRRGSCRRVHHGRRPHAVRAHDGVGRHEGRSSRPAPAIDRDNDPAAESARRACLARPRLGHQFSLFGLSRAVFLAALVRPYGLYRHRALDRSRHAELPDRAQQPAASQRQGQHPADAEADRHRGGRHGGRHAATGAVGRRRARSRRLPPARRDAGSASSPTARPGTPRDGARPTSCTRRSRSEAGGAVQPRTRARRGTRRQDRLRPRRGDRVCRSTVSMARHGGRRPPC